MKKLKTIKSHFKKQDKVIYEVILEMDFSLLPDPEKPSKFFAKLCRDIIAQQLSSKAAKAILDRFTDLFPNKKITPDKVLAISDQKLRKVGLSWAKVKYIKSLAQKTKDKEIIFERLTSLDDEAVIIELTKVKGIGRWTAEMFLMFTLAREDVFSHGDLGLRKAIKKLYGFKDKPNEDEINKIVNKWTPYKTYGCLALWSLFD
jgi:DNA-3-methyladenine glycosylase II